MANSDMGENAICHSHGSNFFYSFVRNSKGMLILYMCSCFILGFKDIQKMPHLSSHNFIARARAGKEEKVIMIKTFPFPLLFRT